MTIAKDGLVKRMRSIAVPLMLMLVIMAIPIQLTKAQAKEITFNVGWAAAVIDTLNPTAMTQMDGGAYNIAHAIYDTLVRSDTNGNPVPDLAESWTYKNATTVELKLAKNAKWHDGQPFSADDVVFSINLFLAHKEFTFLKNTVKTIKSVSASDKYTVQINLKGPDSSFLAFRLIGVFILPKHLWERVANYTTFANPNPVGTGPFKFVRWGGPNTFVEFTANKEYFLGPPNVDRLVFIYFTSYSALALAIQSGEIDYAGPLFSPAVVPTLTSTPGVQVISRPDQRYYYFCFNFYEKGAANPALRDKNVRIALSHAINKPELVTAVWSGYATSQHTVIPVSLGDWVNPKITAYEFNLERAAKMLDDAGYRVGADGVRVNSKGVRLSFKIEVPSNYAQEYRSAQIIANLWKQIGVEATPQLVDVGTLADRVMDWKHDTFIWVWSAGTGIDPDPFLNMFQGSEAMPAPNPGFNDCGFSNSTFDKLYEQQIQEVDPVKRKAIIWRMQEILHQEAVYVPLYDPLAVQAIRSDRFTGVQPGNIPPLNQFSTNNLLLSVKPILVSPQTTTVVTTTMAPSGIGVETVGGIAVAIVVLAAAVFIVTRKRITQEKP
jgi:peptide/nickel transport system substrate-binding protein